MNFLFSRLLCWILILTLWIGGAYWIFTFLQEWEIFGGSDEVTAVEADAAAAGDKPAADAADGEENPLFTGERMWKLGMILGGIFFGHVLLTACLASYRTARRGHVPKGVEVVDLGDYRRKERAAAKTKQRSTVKTTDKAS